MDHQINGTRPKRLGFDRPKEKKELLQPLPIVTTRQKTHKNAILYREPQNSFEIFTMKNSAPYICQAVLTLPVFISSLSFNFFSLLFYD